MNRRTERGRGFTLVELLVVIAIIGILVALLLPAIQAAREAARKASCANNFKQVALALQNYHSNKGEFPVGIEAYFQKKCPGFPSGTYFGWSWSTYILPYLEENTVYDQIPFTKEGYYAEANRKPAGARIGAYLCPSDPNASGEAWVECCVGWSNGGGPTEDFRMTNIVGVADSRSAWCGTTAAGRLDANGMLYNLKKVDLGKVEDGSSHTLMIGEVTGAEGEVPGEGRAYIGFFWVTWTVQDAALGVNGPTTVPGGRLDNVDPLDGDGGNRHDEMREEIGFCSWHPGGAHFAFADGSTHFISEDINQAVFEGLATRANGEVLDNSRF